MTHFDLLHIGPQKSATTWLYACLAEHPEVAVPPRDSIQFFDMHYHRGLDWLDAHFAGAAAGQPRIDMTPSYLRSPLAPRRAYSINPKARIIVSLRDPVERAFSHYWHEKKKSRFDYSFTECLENYDLFANWVEPGFYATHLRRWIDVFGREAILMQEYADLKRDPGYFLQQALIFIGVRDTTFRPSVLDQRVNSASPRTSAPLRRLRRTLAGSRLAPLARSGWAVTAYLGRARGADLERLADVPPKVIAELRAIVEPEIAELEEILGHSLPSLREAGQK